MKINLSICRIASLLAVVLVFGVSCAMGAPAYLEKPIPVQKAPLVPQATSWCRTRTSDRSDTVAPILR